MDKQKVNTTSSMNRKGYSSSSHYRINPVAEKREQVVACFDFFDVLKKYLVNQYGQWTEYYAPDRTSLRAYLYGRINQIVEIPKY